MRSAERAGGRFLSFSSDRYIIVWKIPGTVIPDTRFLPSLTMFLVPPSACQREPVNQKFLHTPFSTIFNSTWFWRDLFQQILISRKSTSRKERQTFLNASRLILDRSSASFSSIFKNVYKIFLLLPHRPRKKSHAIKETRERSGGKRSKRNMLENSAATKLHLSWKKEEERERVNPETWSWWRARAEKDRRNRGGGSIYPWQRRHYIRIIVVAGRAPFEKPFLHFEFISSPRCTRS